MSGPWYETSGPNVEQVRTDILEHFKNLVCEKKHYKDDEIKQYLSKHLVKIVPDERNDFGSYRGYSCFTKPDIIKKLKDSMIDNYDLKFIKNE